MVEILVVGASAVVIGAAVNRWWVISLPIVAAVAWVVVAAIGGGEDSDGMPNWQLAAYVGTMLAVTAIFGLSVGLVWGRWVRERYCA